MDVHRAAGRKTRMQAQPNCENVQGASQAPKWHSPELSCVDQTIAKASILSQPADGIETLWRGQRRAIERRSLCRPCAVGHTGDPSADRSGSALGSVSLAASDEALMCSHAAFSKHLPSAALSCSIVRGTASKPSHQGRPRPKSLRSPNKSSELTLAGQRSQRWSLPDWARSSKPSTNPHCCSSLLSS